MSSKECSSRSAPGKQSRVRICLSFILRNITFRSSDWNGHEWRAMLVVLCTFVSTYGAIATLGEWRLRGTGSPWTALPWTLLAAFLLAITRERRVLACTVLAVFAFYGVRGLLLFRDPLGYWFVGISIALISLLLITASRGG